jgi:hypothetical protein
MQPTVACLSTKLDELQVVCRLEFRKQDAYQVGGAMMENVFNASHVR